MPALARRDIDVIGADAVEDGTSIATFKTAAEYAKWLAVENGDFRATDDDLASKFRANATETGAVLSAISRASSHPVISGMVWSVITREYPFADTARSSSASAADANSFVW